MATNTDLMDILGESTYNPGSLQSRQDLASHLIALLEEKGFRDETPAGNFVGYNRWAGRYSKPQERRFSFPVGDSRIRILVWTGIANDSDHARGKGQDSIKVTAVYTDRKGQDRGIVKAQRVHRTGKLDLIIERVFERSRDVWRKVAASERCTHCGAPKFESKAGNMVCAEFCWKR